MSTFSSHKLDLAFFPHTLTKTHTHKSVSIKVPPGAARISLHDNEHLGENIRNVVNKTQVADDVLE